MAGYDSTSLAISIGDGSSPAEVFHPLGSISRARILSTREERNRNSPANGPWQARQASGGLQNMRLQADGVFTDGAADGILRERLFAGDCCNLQIAFAEGGMLEGAFMLTRYEWSLDVAGELRFSLDMSGAADMEYTPPA